MANFPYQPLDLQSHEIRILNLEWNRMFDELSGTLEHVLLVDPGPYIALSYCWGDRNNSHFLEISPDPGTPRFEVNITDNLGSALWALWKRKKNDEKYLRIWVDAICINQSDTFERSQQVQVMRQIYSKASSVVAWVDHFDRTVFLKNRDHLSDFYAGKEYIRLDNTQRHSESWRSLKDFFDEMYWKRVWIIQEITVARAVTVLYGDLEFSLDQVLTSLSWLLSTQVDSSSQTEYSSNQTTVGASHLLKFGEHYVQENKPISLFQAMSWTLHTMATDPRDKIFALLGLCHDGTRLVPVPNYRQSLESIISDMSRSMITLSRSLDIICLKGSNSPQTNHPELPTWAPNWPNLWGGSTTAGENEILENKTTFSFNPILPSSTDSVIKVQGVYIGRINGISQSLAATTDQRQYQQNPGSWLHSLNSDIITIDPLEIQQRKCIWKTMTMSHLSYPERSTSPSCFQELWTPSGRGSIYNTRIIDWIDCNASFKIGPWALHEWSQLLGQPSPPLSPSSAGKRRVTLRSLFGSDTTTKEVETSSKTTETDTNPWPAVNNALEKVLLGGMRLAELRCNSLQEAPDYHSRQNAPTLVNPYAQVSDEIFFLRGCSMPVILRERGPLMDQYLVVGGAWLDLDLKWFRVCHAVAASHDQHRPVPGLHDLLSLR